MARSCVESKTYLGSMKFAGTMMVLPSALCGGPMVSATGKAPSIFLEGGNFWVRSWCLMRLLGSLPPMVSGRWAVGMANYTDLTWRASISGLGRLQDPRIMTAIYTRGQILIM